MKQWGLKIEICSLPSRSRALCMSGGTRASTSTTAATERGRARALAERRQKMIDDCEQNFAAKRIARDEVDTSCAPRRTVRRPRHPPQAAS